MPAWCARNSFAGPATSRTSRYSVPARAARTASRQRRRPNYFLEMSSKSRSAQRAFRWPAVTSRAKPQHPSSGSSGSATNRTPSVTRLAGISMLDTSTPANLQSRAAPGNVVSLADMIDVLRRRWGTFLFAIALALAAGGFYMTVARPSYSATAQVMIDTKRSDSPGAQFAVVDTAVVESQIETIKTDKIAVAVIKKLALDEDPEFIVPGRAMRFLSMVGLVQLDRPTTEQGR